MKTPYLVLGLLGLLALSTCKTPQQQIDRQTATEIDICPVERRNGWRWKYKVIAAAFTAESFKGGWVGSYDFSFFFASAAQKKNFHLCSSIANVTRLWWWRLIPSKRLKCPRCVIVLVCLFSTSKFFPAQCIFQHGNGRLLIG